MNGLTIVIAILLYGAGVAMITASILGPRRARRPVVRLPDWSARNRPRVRCAPATPSAEEIIGRFAGSAKAGQPVLIEMPSASAWTSPPRPETVDDITAWWWA